MYELMRVGERSLYINCPAKIGIYEAEDGAYLIDSGNDKDAGRKVRQILEKNNRTLKGILNTHSNADHIGGNKYLQSQTGCKVFSRGIEAAFTENPILEPSFLYGGYPAKDLRHKFLLAQESAVSPFTDADFPKEVEIIDLPGHFFDMTGFKTPDGTAYIADCLASRATLDKYAIPFIYDVRAYIETLERVAKMEAKMFVPSHAEATDDIAPLAEYNREKTFEVAEKIAELCREAINFEEILKKLFDFYNLTLNFEQYVLVGSTVRSYLSYLKDEGQLDVVFEDNRLLWQAR